MPVEESLTALTETDLQTYLTLLAEREAVFARLLQRVGLPPLWARQPGFATLVHMILEQQVSLASARAAFDRLNALCPLLTPEVFLELDDAALLAVGFSRQKTRYCRELARALLAGELDLAALAWLPDDAVRAALTRVKGIGPWTAEIYLLMVLRPPDVWPQHDRALAVAVQRAWDLPEAPSPDALEQISQAWRPYRACAARLLWHFYLSRGWQ